MVTMDQADILQELLIRARAGDAAACAQLTGTLNPTFVKIAQKILTSRRSVEDVKEVVQASQLQIIEAIHGHEEIHKVRAYAVKIAKNCARKFLEKNSYDREKRPSDPYFHSKMPWLKPKPYSLEKDTITRDELRLLKQELEKLLSPPENLVYQLHFFQELTTEAVAAQMGITVNYLHQHLRQIRKKARSIRDKQT